MKKSFFSWLKSVVVFLPFCGCFLCCGEQKNYEAYFNNAHKYASTVKQLNDVVLSNNFPPVIASRNYAYACIAGYECLASQNPAYKSLAGQIKHLPPIPKPSSEVYVPLSALLAVLKVGDAVTFPEGALMDAYHKLLQEADSLGLSKEAIEASDSFAQSVAKNILAWSKKDNYLQTRGSKKYAVMIGADGRWIPTPPAYMDALEPNWMFIRTMVLDSAGMFPAPAPPKVEIKNHQSPYYKAMMEVKNIGDSLTAEQKHIADFWDDNPFKMNVVGHVMYATKKFSPPGHWLNIIGIAADKKGSDMTYTAAAFAHGAIALFDAFISCWYQKYTSNYVRPETVINKYVSDTWRPYIQTPPFPSYTSGHATISASVAEVMTAYFGDNFSFVDTSLLAFGIPNRQIRSFRQAAKEAALSRLYGGIHYRFDNEEGAKIGAKIGSLIVSRLRLSVQPMSK